MNRFKSARFEKGLSIRDVAQSTGLARQTVKRLEEGGEPSARAVKTLSDFYGVSVSELLGLDEPKLAA